MKYTYSDLVPKINPHRIVSVSALMFNKKTKKIFLEFSPNALFFKEFNTNGSWFQLPNNNLYPCPKKNNYTITSDNILYWTNENFENLSKICININKTSHTTNNWVVDLLESLSIFNINRSRRVRLILRIDCLQWQPYFWNDDDFMSSRLDVIKKVFQHTKELIRQNGGIDIQIRYSTFNFAECHKLFLQIMSRVLSSKNRNAVVVKHENDLETQMTLFQARSCS